MGIWALIGGYFFIYMTNTSIPNAGDDVTCQFICVIIPYDASKKLRFSDHLLNNSLV